MRKQQSDLQVMKTRIKSHYTEKIHVSSLVKLGCSYMERLLNWIFPNV